MIMSDRMMEPLRDTWGRLRKASRGRLAAADTRR